jgi:xanthine dehydrogenase YagR molybdenum-binding subunit
MPEATTNPQTLPAPTVPLADRTSIIGKPTDRVDGRLKVTGAAKYAAEFDVPGLVHAVAFVSTIGKGTVKKIDTYDAERSDGVLAVITRRNADEIFFVDRHPRPPQEGQPGQTLAPLQDDSVHFAGQYLGLVVACTIEQATHAAQLVKIDYDEETPTLDIAHPIEHTKANPRGRGNITKALASANLKIQQTYSTGVYHHNPMETHSTIAAWDGEKLTLYDSTQHVRGVRRVTATALGIEPEDIRVIDPFVGGGFGSKGSVWPNTYLAAIAARYVGRPVKLVLTRSQMFSQVGYRPKTVQNISLGADANGKLLAITHDNTSQTSDFDEWTEGSTGAATFLYSCSSVRTSQRLARLNFGTPTQMRAPGWATGTFALESAMDELAALAGIDPLELRLRNYAETDEDIKLAYSSKNLRECYRDGADRFGWAKRPAKPRSMRDGDELIGWGMATAVYPAHAGTSAAQIRLLPDGSACVEVAAHDLGTGTYTIFAQIAAEGLGLDVPNVRVELADTVLAASGPAGGSRTASSVGPAVLAAAQQLIQNVAHYSVNDPNSALFGKDPRQIIARGGRIVLADDEAIGEKLTSVFERNGGRPVIAFVDTGSQIRDEKFSAYAWGAQFTEVRVNPKLGRVRVSRHVGAFAAGRILNAKTARSQFLGAIVMGIGMALLERSAFDPIRGKMVTDSLADYLVPVNADVPAIEIISVDEKDDLVNTLGAKGIGEIGITGVAASIANAVYHATGKRVREVPITVESILET